MNTPPSHANLRARTSTGHDPRAGFAALTAFAFATLLGCAEPSSPAGEPSAGHDPDASPERILLAPVAATLSPGDTIRFTAGALDGFGTPITSDFTWTYDGGDLAPDGVYIAGPNPGVFSVVVETAGGLADTSWVTILVDAAVPSVRVTPSSATLAPAESQQFVAEIVDEFGDLVPGTLSWSAEGGVIGADGWFVAGSVAGSFEVVATHTASGGSGSAQVIVTAPPDFDVAIAPGEDIQAAVQTHPPGTRFLLRTGVHARQEVTPRDGNVFLGEPGTILDGEGVAEFAFRGTTGIDDVTIAGLEIRNYDPPVQWGAVRGVDTRRWTVADNEIHHCTGGIRLGAEMAVLRNHVHHNRQTGIMGQGNGAHIAENEVAYNNFDLEFDPDASPETFEAGGMKITYSENVTISDNFVHHNGVTGIWLDLDNRNVVIEGNRVEDNFYQGIYYEISYDAVIRNNTVRRNGFSGNWYHKAGIVIASSVNVEVFGNTLSENAMGIIGSQVERGEGSFGPHWLQNLYVHHNTVTQVEGVIGVVRDDSVGNEVFESRNNHFEGNAYFLGENPRYFRWGQSDLTDSEWIDAGHDTTGEFHRP